MFIGDIRMITGCGKLCRAAPKSVQVILPEIDRMKFNVIFDVRADGLAGELVVFSNLEWECDYMNVETAEVFAKLLLLLRADIFEVLISKHNHATFSDEQREFVFLRVAQLGELEATDLSADARRQFRGFHGGISFWQKAGLCWVRIMATVVEIKELCRWKLGGCVVDWEVRSVFRLYVHMSAR
jgi:hypothetical protein